MSNHDEGYAVPEDSKPDKSSPQSFVKGVSLQSKPPTLVLDIEKYIHQFDGYDLSEDQKIEILKSLWQIMSCFVELGFGLDSVSLACAQNGKTTGLERDILLDCEHIKQTNNK